MPSSMLGTFQYIVRNNGLLGLYAGLSASLLRQITYSTTRFGIYEELKTRLTKKNNGTQPSFPVLVALSCTSGFIGGISGNAADITNVRMQHDAALPPEKRRNYKHALDGMLRMAREEGLMSWFRGVLPNSLRAAAMTASQLASYDTFKKLLIGHTPMTDNPRDTLHGVIPCWGHGRDGDLPHRRGEDESHVCERQKYKHSCPAEGFVRK
ncbi:hypothetical protein OPQ81_005369 [Rhizoctonia solani]|nr:hypothetical protein OPQ81_005369 [Rhizoctonia solani]